MLTTSIDPLVGTDKGDVFNAVIDGTTAANATLTALDNLDGAAGNDTLNISNTSALANDKTDLSVATIKNIETINIQAVGDISSADAANTIGTNEVDFSNIAGLTTINTTKSVNTLLKAAATTDVNVSGATGDISVIGGKDVVVNDNTADTIISVSAGAATGNAAGTITVTDTNAKGTVGTDDIKIDGGTDVTVTATSAATSADIIIGANKVATGAVVVTQNVTSDATGPVVAGAVTVTGGSTIDITSNLTTTSGATGNTTVITDDTITATGDGSTTSVTITQNSVANDFAGSAATTAATTETAVVTFGALAAGESVTIGETGTIAVDTDLTFTASKDLTAAEVAAAFANLTAADTQAAGGVVANGYFEGALDAGWTTGVASGATVTFTATSTGNKTNLAYDTDLNSTAASADAAVADADFGIAVTDGAAAVGATAANNITATYGDVVVKDNGTAAITTITLDGFDNATLGATGSLDKLATLNLTNGQSTGTTALTSTVATLNVTLDDMAGTVDLGGAAVATLKTLNLTTTGEASTIILDADAVETLTIAAAANLDISNVGTNLSAVKTATITGAGNVNLGNLSGSTSFATLTASAATGDISATVDGDKATVTTGSGDDEITVNTATQTKDINLGSGDDTLTYSAATMGLPTGAIAGGKGIDTIKMTFASAQSLDGNTNFATAISGFERLTISNQAVMTTADITIDLEALGFSYVTLAAGTDDTENTAANKLILDNMATGGTLVMNATQSATGSQASTQVNVKDAATGKSDSLNIIISAEATVDAKTVTANNVETFNITATDVYLDNSGVDTNNAVHKLTASGDKVTSIVVTGDDLNLDTDSTVLTSVDASAMTGGIIYTADGAAAGTTVKGGQGTDQLTASGSGDKLIGGAGNDILLGDNLTTLTGGAGNDTFKMNAPTNVNSYSTITDLSSGDVIDLASSTTTTGNVFVSSAIVLADTAVFQDYANAAVNQLASDNYDFGWFQFGGNTYIVANDNQADATDANFENGVDSIIKISGLVDLSTASYNQANGTLEIA